MIHQTKAGENGKVFYNKLVRDRIKEKIEKNGESCEVRVIDDEQEFQQELLKKIKEEAEALAAVSSRDEFLQEYADLMVVLDALTHQMEFSEADIKTAIEENVAKKGLYKLRHFLHWSDAGKYKSNETPQGIQ
jgi:predicted house-cleaning noncanonical NTP pyrophosphatase (MazG superfamily)